MALHFDLCVNHDPVGQFVAQRRDDVIPPDRICTYDVTVTSGGETLRAVVRHNYDHGAFALVAAGIHATAGPQATEES